MAVVVDRRRKGRGEREMRARGKHSHQENAEQVGAARGKREPPESRPATMRPRRDVDDANVDPGPPWFDSAAEEEAEEAAELATPFNLAGEVGGGRRWRRRQRSGADAVEDAGDD